MRCSSEVKPDLLRVPKDTVEIRNNKLQAQTTPKVNPQVQDSVVTAKQSSVNQNKNKLFGKQGTRGGKFSGKRRISARL